MFGPILYSLVREAAKSPTLWEKALEKAVLAAAGIIGVAVADAAVQGARNLSGNKKSTRPQTKLRLPPRC